MKKELNTKENVIRMQGVEDLTNVDEYTEIIFEGFYNYIFNTLVDYYDPAKEYIEEVNKNKSLIESELNKIISDHVAYLNDNYQPELEDTYELFVNIISNIDIDIIYALDDFEKYYCVQFIKYIIEKGAGICA